MSKKPARHVLDVYDLHLYLATSKKQWRTLAKELPFLNPEPPDAGGCVHFAVWEPKQGLAEPHAVVFIDTTDHGDDQAQLVDTIAHEATHVTQQLLHHVGHTTQGPDEPAAYLVGWITRWLWRHITQAAA